MSLASPSPVRFHVCVAGTRPGTIRRIGARYRTLARARQVRHSGLGRPLTETAIYQVTFGLVPILIEGNLQPAQS